MEVSMDGIIKTLVCKVANLKGSINGFDKDDLPCEQKEYFNAEIVPALNEVISTTNFICEIYDHNIARDHYKLNRHIGLIEESEE